MLMLQLHLVLAYGGLIQLFNTYAIEYCMKRGTCTIEQACVRACVIVLLVTILHCECGVG